MSPNLSVLILTANEEANLAQTLDSVCGWAKEIFIVDSFSTDQTLDIARRYGCPIYQFPFESYSRQRNRALDELPLATDWLLFLDADEWLPEDLKREITDTLAGQPAEQGFFLRRRFYWMDTWIKRGYYPVSILRLFRRGCARCEDRAVNEHIVVHGPTRSLTHDFIHQDRKPLSDWISKHNRYALQEAQELLRREAAASEKLPARFWGPPAERVRWLRERLYNRLPPLLRPCLFFFYRALLRGGFLDGPRALVYHFLQAFWYPLLIDLYFLELRRAARPSAPSARAPSLSTATLDLSHEHPVSRR
jgi:glycosyltransferase involved in cell wall biosynthesis